MFTFLSTSMCSEYFFTLLYTFCKNQSILTNITLNTEKYFLPPAYPDTLSYSKNLKLPTPHGVLNLEKSIL